MEAEGSAATALVGEGGHQGEDEAEEGAGKAKLDIVAGKTKPIQPFRVTSVRLNYQWHDEEIGKDSSNTDANIDCCCFW